jgi:hypothetical protein
MDLFDLIYNWYRWFLVENLPLTLAVMVVMMTMSWLAMRVETPEDYWWSADKDDPDIN